MKLSLVVLAQGKQEGKVLPIALSQFVIGRDPQCHLRPASPSISKRHCALLERDGKFFVVDFDSTNGTFLNDEPVKGERELKDGDMLKVGPLTFGIKVEAGAPARPAPPASNPAVKKPAVPEPAAQKTAPEKPAANNTPEKKAPAKAPAPSSASGGEADDDIAAMLLSLGDEGTGEAKVPEGSTVHEMTVPDLPGETQPSGEGGQAKEKEKEKPKPAASTSSAAKAILEQYMKRPRPSTPS